ncbi:high mobility group box domain-containing protein [Phycomyces nitens]|nr:high mobility group box domain-containing protein [Phycomyces nitens]
MAFSFDPTHLQDDQRAFLGQAHVKDFLSRSGLGQYTQIFIEEGFDRLDSLFEVTEADLIHLGVKRGHRRLLQRAIANSRGIPSSLPLQIPESSMRRPMLDYENPIQATPPSMYAQEHLNNSASPMPLASPRSSSAGPSISHVSGGAVTSGMSSTEDDNTPGDSTGRLWKRKYQRHAKPDKNCPLKPSSAYVMFSNDVRAELRARNMTFTELAKLVGDRWKNLNHDDKQRYETNAMLARKQYQVRLEEYQRTDDFKEYQEYIRDFKAKHEAAGKSVCFPIGSNAPCI